VERVGWRTSDGLLIPAIRIAPRDSVRGTLLGAADAGKESLVGHATVRAAVEVRPFIMAQVED
jgi:hypothetical protein